MLAHSNAQTRNTSVFAQSSETCLDSLSYQADGFVAAAKGFTKIVRSTSAEASMVLRIVSGMHLSCVPRWHRVEAGVVTTDRDFVQESFNNLMR